jgi:hypothetical protein
MGEVGVLVDVNRLLDVARPQQPRGSLGHDHGGNRRDA